MTLLRAVNHAGRRSGRPPGSVDLGASCVRPVPLPEAMRFAVQVGLAIRHLREEQHIAASELAAAIGVGTAAVLAWERGHAPSVPRLYQIATALGIQVADILGAVEAA